VLVLWVGVANAGKKKKIVVLDFKGPSAEKIHDEVVKLVDKKHTIISTEKWNATAEELDATKINSKNIAKISKKLKVDGVIWGKITKRDGDYIIKLKLRSGQTGAVLGDSVQTQSTKSSLDKTAERDINDELVPRIADLEENAGGGDDVAGADMDKPRKSGFGHKDDEEDRDVPRDEPKKKKHKDDDDDGATAAALETKKDEPSDDDKPKKKKKKKEVAEEDDGGEGEGGGEDDGGEDASISGEEDAGPEDVALNLSPGHRAIDAALGLSFTRRNLKFSYDADLASVPPGYKQSVPVGGGLVDITAYPLAFGHKKKDITTNIGVHVLFDQALVLSSKKTFFDDMGTAQKATLSTKEVRWLVGAVFRYPIGTGVKAPVVGGSLSYGKQTFRVDPTLPGTDMSSDIPSVKYTMITPAAFVKFPVTEKIILNLDLAFHAITNTGMIQERDQYGAATVSGYSAVFGADYMITSKIFARLSARYQSISFSFKGDPMAQTNTRDSDPDQDVKGAKDTYLGGSLTAGYVF
jgi:hypothetical protein